jgi:hypothetical protein
MTSLHVPPRAALLALALLALALLATPALTQAQAAPPVQPAPATATTPAPRPADVASVDALITALYAVISGPPGQARDWDRMRSLFHPSARMEPIVRNPAGGFTVRVLAPDDYVRGSGEMLTRHGFTERELTRRVERFGNLVHVWSTYEGRFTSDTAPTKEPIRGINSIQLAHDGSRWWILNLTWEAERADQRLPAEYLPK